MAAATVLALDSATDACSVALWRDGSIQARRFEPRRHGQAEILMPMVRDVMRQGRQDFQSLDAIATTVGPGGFTGLRIGLASARALALAAGKPVMGMTTLEVVAAAQPDQDCPLLVAIDSRRPDVYVQLFSAAHEPVNAPAAILPEDIGSMLAEGPVTIAGNATELVMRAQSQRGILRSNGPELPDAAILARVAAERADMLNPESPPPGPLYLRPPDAKLPSKKRA